MAWRTTYANKHAARLIRGGLVFVGISKKEEFVGTTT